MYSIAKKIAYSFLYQVCIWKRVKSNSLLVLTYHRISDVPEYRDALKVSVETFEKQMLFVKKNYRLISADELADIISTKKPFPQNSCLITFDDGWRDNFTHAFPVLKKYRIPAIIFLSTDYVGTNKVFWHEQLVRILEHDDSYPDTKELNAVLGEYPEVLSRIDRIAELPPAKRRPLIEDLISCLKGFPPKSIDYVLQKLHTVMDNSGVEGKEPVVLDWEQIREMAQYNIGFGSHTKSHAILTNLDPDQLREEIIESKRIIEDKLGKPVHFIAYPNGNYTRHVLRITEEAGYLAGFTCDPGINASYHRQFELKRKHILEECSLGLTGQFSEYALKTELSGIRNDLQCWIRRDGQCGGKG